MNVKLSRMGFPCLKRGVDLVERSVWIRTALMGWMVMSMATSLAAQETVVVQTSSGKLEGIRRSHEILIDKAEIVTNVVDEFLGVPYAAPPVGDLRFRAPGKPSSWSGIREAKSPGAACPQRIYANVNSRYTDKMDEDCLYLNVYSPYLDTERRRQPGSQSASAFPVMLFVHGGSFLYGTGSIYNGSALAMFGVLVVTINYRLDLLGFLATGSADLPGNYGLMDQILAMEWIQQNIRSFRGDPSRVTIFGSSAGGASVGLAFLSPLAQGLFHRVIAESGTANAFWATNGDKTPARLLTEVNSIAESKSCLRSTVKGTVECLRSLPWTSLIHSDEMCMVLFCSEIDPVVKPVIDGHVLTDDPSQLLRQAKFNTNIPYMTGIVRNEFGTYLHNYSEFYMWREVDMFLSRKYDDTVLQTIAMSYTDWTHENADPQHLNSGVKIYDRAQALFDLGLLAPITQMASDIASVPDTAVYAYYFDMEESYHSVELIYVFGLPYIGGMMDEYDKDFTLQFSTEVMKRTSLTVMRLWTNFAKYGNPTPLGKPTEAVEDIQWTKFNPVNGGCLNIKANSTDLELRMMKHLHADKTVLWNVIVPAIAAKNCGRSCEVAYNGTKTALLIGLIAALSSILVFLICFNICALRHGMIQFESKRPRQC